MSGQFLHGIETIELTSGVRPIRTVRTAVVGLVGTAPVWAVADQRINTPVLITSLQDAVKYFGVERAGYSIPAALRAIFSQGRGAAIVVNVFDPAVHKTAVALADHVLDATGVVMLADQGVANVVVKDAAGAVTYVVDVDYTLDAIAGTVTRKNTGAIAAGATIKVGYDKPDPTLVVSADIVGTVDGGGVRSGTQAFLDAQTAIGFGPKILLAPAYSSAELVADALETLAAQLRAVALIDAPAGTTVDHAIAARAPGGDINLARTSDRSLLCYPYVHALDSNGVDQLEPYSQHLAGAIAQRDDEKGYWWSPSNTPLPSIVGLERALTFAYNDPDCEVNRLNAAGIVTIAPVNGSFRVWGNRSSAFPSSDDPQNFIAVRRVADILHESIELALLPYVDRPITLALTDSVASTVNQFLRVLIGRSAIVAGDCHYDPADNPPEELSAGHLTFALEFDPPPPAERITIKSVINTDLLAPTLVGQG